MTPEVSVIITAHNRKQYLLDAVKSVIDQDLDRKKFEVLVVKNFHDVAVDKFLERESIKSFYTEEQPFGVKLSIGIENSVGGIITFLDDDDLFARNKLSSLIEAFKDKQMVYHHSSILTIDESGREYEGGLSDNIPVTRTIESGIAENMKLVMRYKLHWYMSAISCRAPTIKAFSNLIKNTPASLDKLAFFICVESGGGFFFDSRPLTKYRVHESLTTKITDRDTLLESRREFYSRSLKSLEHARGAFERHGTQKLMQLELIHGKLLVYFFSDDIEDKISSRKLEKLTLFSLWKGLRTITFWSLSGIFRKLFPTAARSIYFNRTIKNFKKFSR